MNEGLFRAVYVSAASHDLADGELAAILDVSRRNNVAWGVTGALAYHDRAFVQVLEGPEAAVEALLEATRVRGMGRRRDNRFAHALEAARREVRRALAATGAGSGSGPA